MEFLGFLLPPVIDLINRKVGDSDKRFWLSVLVCSLVGIGLYWLETGFVAETRMAIFEGLTKAILAVFGMAQISYKAVWENSPVREGLGMNAEINKMEGKI